MSERGRSRRPATVLIVAAMVIPPGLPAVAWPGDAEAVSVIESGGLSDRTIGALETAAEVTGGRLGTVHAGTLRLMSVTRDGVDVQRPEAGYGYPMSVAAVDPVQMEPLLGGDLARLLTPGAVVMSERSAALRGAQAGDVVELEGWNGDTLSLPISGVVPDDDLGWSELVFSTVTAAELGFERPSRMYLWDIPSPRLAALVIRAGLPDGPIRVRLPGEPIDVTDFTLATVEVKELFGEFSFRPSGVGDGIDIDRDWLTENIVWVDYPRLGPFRCHRLVAPALEAALADLERSGLADEIDFVDFQLAGGCFNARLMRGGDRGFALSRHSWGIAIDINPSTNRYGSEFALTEPFGETFRRWGFSWGAGWLVPDGMHFEWARPTPEADRCVPAVTEVGASGPWRDCVAV